MTPESELPINRNVLLVDDDKSIHAAYRRILGERRRPTPHVATFDLQSAFQGPEALALVEQARRDARPYAMAFVDLRMPPSWDGIQTVRRLWEADPHLQVVICSGHCEEDWTEIARGFGQSDGFLMLKKPFDNTEVRQIAHALTRKWSLEHAARARNIALETLVDARTAELQEAQLRLEAEHRERLRMESELRLAQKLEAVGQLAAGIAHEINTPMQYIGDSVHFLRRAFDDLIVAVEVCAGGARDGEAIDHGDIDYLRQQIPRAFERTLEGIERVGAIVRAMRDFAHPGQSEKAPADINRAVESALIVSRNEYKYVADVEMSLDQIPLVECQLGELNQVLLNLIVNAAHAIGDRGAETRGLIHVTTQAIGDSVRISITDSGSGIPERIRDRIFDPFFTTKPVGKGTGQGLAIARSIIVDKHGGRLAFETEVGRGTTFHIELPVSAREAH